MESKVGAVEKKKRFVDPKVERAMKVHDTNPLGKFPWSTNPKPVEKEDVEGVKGAFILRNVLTPEECEFLIKSSETMGYTEAPISTGLSSAVMMKDVRDNERVMWEMSKEELQVMWDRVKQLLPNDIRFGGKTWRLVDPQGFNERIRFYRYAERQIFQPHYDGAFPRSHEEMSHLTFIIYLNDGFKFGHTTFFPKGYMDMDNQVKIDPTTGSALLFFHTGSYSPLHEGAPHYSEGKFKYVFRSDIMYKVVKS